ncbi:MAG: hypothetical protein KatS3mg124_2346 [Porticoccaceae bacterium]|nr:MAG: hypothetical protein KatS3mg124_2346 [Porticoccaceae bacterium]
MEPAAIERTIRDAWPEAEVEVAGDGRHFDLVVVTDRFAGLRKIRRQQMVYALLGDAIARGELHALNIHPFTPAERDERAGGSWSGS